MVDKASSVTVIGSSELPYQNTLGREIGKVSMMVRKRESRMISLNHFPFSATCSLNSVVAADADRTKREILHE